MWTGFFSYLQLPNKLGVLCRFPGSPAQFYLMPFKSIGSLESRVHRLWPLVTALCPHSNTWWCVGGVKPLNPRSWQGSHLYKALCLLHLTQKSASCVVHIQGMELSLIQAKGSRHCCSPRLSLLPGKCITLEWVSSPSDPVLESLLPKSWTWRLQWVWVQSVICALPPISKIPHPSGEHVLSKAQTSSEATTLLKIPQWLLIALIRKNNQKGKDRET